MKHGDRLTEITKDVITTVVTVYLYTTNTYGAHPLVFGATLDM